MFLVIIWSVVVTMLSFSVETQFNQVIKELDNKPFFQKTTTGLCIAQLEHGFFSYNGNKFLRPASTLKLLSSALAYEYLNHEKPFSTKFGYIGDIKEGVLQGDLILKGESDPTFGSDRFEDFNKVLKTFCLLLKGLKIERIEGNLIIDHSFFEQALAVSSWLYEDLGNYYGVGASGLNFHENNYTITFKLGKKVGEVAQLVDCFPKIDHLNLVSRVTTKEKGSGDRAFVFGQEYSNDQKVLGTLPLDSAYFSIKGSIPNPAIFFLNSLKKHLLKEGIAFNGKSYSSFKRETRKINWIDTKYSPSLNKIIELTLKYSINLYSEALLKRVALEKTSFGSTDNGLLYFNQFLENLNVSLDDISLYDASGLSSKNLITPNAFVQALEALKKKGYFPDFLHAIPKASRYKVFQDLDDSVKNKIFVKSGSSSQCISYAGYVQTIKGSYRAFCFICNNAEKNRDEFHLLAKQLFNMMVKL